MNEGVFSRVENLLTQHGVRFDVLRHQPVFTSEEAAAVRGVPLSTGAKALICKRCLGAAADHHLASLRHHSKNR